MSTAPTGAEPVKLGPQDTSAPGDTAEVTTVQLWGEVKVGRIMLLAKALFFPLVMHTFASVNGNMV